MISLRQSVNDLERLAELQKSTLSSYQLAIRAVADYAVELDLTQVAEYRQHLLTLQHSLDKASSSEDFEAVESSFRGELRDYRDRSNHWIEKNRGDLQAATDSMQVLAETVAANGTDHAKVLTTDLEKLVTVADSQDLTQIRSVIRSTTQSIRESYVCLQRETKLVVAQFHDELRSLHREIDSERKALFTDAASGAWNREKLKLRMTELLNRGDGFCVVILWITNLKRLRAGASAAVIDGALQAMVKRMKGLVGTDASIGRWGGDEFAVILELVPSTALASATEMAQTLSTRYSVQENGVAQNLTLRIATAMLDHSPGGDPGRFHEKLRSLSAAMQES
jgi:GGDEF domain-containing protein